MIFGADIPSIWNVPNGTLTFPNSNVINNYVQLDSLEQVSVIDGDRNWTKTQNAGFQIFVNLFKRENPKQDLLNILNYKYNTVLFRRHKDVKPYRTDFKVVSIVPFYLETTQFIDKVSILLLGTQITKLFDEGNYGDDYGNDYGNTGW